MLKLILADDEPVIVRGIQKLVDWEKLGISIVGEFENGRSAMEGILSLKPDIALLDISMPEMDGIEILKNIHKLGLATKVIFISGFQDFEYARSAITYGAVEYLLKPLILDELLRAIEKAAEMLSGYELPVFKEEGSRRKEPTGEGAEDLLENTTYLPVLADILFQNGESEQVRKLMYFSFISFLEEYLTDNNLGILFSRDNQIVMVFKGMDAEQVSRELYELQEQTSALMDKKTAFIIGTLVDSMGKIPEEYERCLAMKGYFFFEEQMGVPVLQVGKRVFARQAGMAELSEVRGQLMDAVFVQDDETFSSAFARFSRVLCLVADGRKEDACYYFCSSVRLLEEKMNNMNLEGKNPDIRRLLEEGRACQSYGQMCTLFRSYMRGYMELLKSMMENNEKKDIVIAKAYIEEHYRENLSLEVLAGIVHRNPYYFSSFFKKNAGENFKDYVNKVRISHGVSLLMSTDLKTYEIAMETGFRDARAFTEAFSRVYGETPNSYKKRVRKKK